VRALAAEDIELFCSEIDNSSSSSSRLLKERRIAERRNFFSCVQCAPPAETHSWPESYTLSVSKFAAAAFAS